MVYYEKAPHRRRASAPISPVRLEHEKSHLNQSIYNWLYLSVWLGLRPIEIDQLKEKKYYHVRSTPHGPSVLWVCQTKLTSRPPWQRWKPIPLLYPEQRLCLAIIKHRKFKRPLVKTIKRWFGRDTSTYAGRKGFTDLMLGRKQDLANISQWMGHSSLDPRRKGVARLNGSRNFKKLHGIIGCEARSVGRFLKFRLPEVFFGQSYPHTLAKGLI